MAKQNIPEFQRKGLNYYQLLALEIFHGKRTLREIEIELKSSHDGWKTYFAVERALKRFNRYRP